MSSIKVSVIIPTYNRENLLDFTLKSFEQQNMNKEEYEIIICDDGSDDNTFNLVKSYEEKINIKYCYHSHDSFRAALTRNMGINIARGEICVFIDSGMIACKKFLEEHYKEHKKSEKSCIVAGSILGFKISSEWEEKLKSNFDINDLDQSFNRLNKEKNFHDEREITINHIGKDMSTWPAPWIYFWSGNISVKKEELEKVGLFDEKYIGWGGEDTDLGIRLFLNNLKYVFSEKAQAIHYPHPQTSIDESELKNRVIQRKTFLCERYGTKIKGMEYWLEVGSTRLNNFLFDNFVVK